MSEKIVLVEGKLTHGIQQNGHHLVTFQTDRDEIDGWFPVAKVHSIPESDSQWIASIIEQHTTTYTQKPNGWWEWKCSCGDSAEEFRERQHCEKMTRGHWANKIWEKLAT